MIVVELQLNPTDRALQITVVNLKLQMYWGFSSVCKYSNRGRGDFDAGDAKRPEIRTSEPHKFSCWQISWRPAFYLQLDSQCEYATLWVWHYTCVHVHRYGAMTESKEITFKFIHGFRRSLLFDTIKIPKQPL